jgi:hypothetical protein
MGRIPPSLPYSRYLSFSELFSTLNIDFAAHNAGIFYASTRRYSLSEGNMGLIDPNFSGAGSGS